MQKRMALVILQGLLISLVIISGASAQSPQIESGLAYLIAIQNSDGSWPGTGNRGPLSTTCNVAETLSALNRQNIPSYANALLWIQTQNADATEQLAARIHALSIEGTDDELLLSYLDEIYTGAWSGDDSPDVDNLDTLLALQALMKINYSDQEVISRALYYLISTQNPDGGWGFKQGEDSEVYYAALVLQTLSQFKSTYDLNVQITSAAAFLLAHQNVDGGFGSPASTGSGQGSSTVYETALSVIALIAMSTIAIETGTMTTGNSGSSSTGMRSSTCYQQGTMCLCI